VRAAPVGDEEPVAAVVRDRHGLDPLRAEVAGELGHRHPRLAEGREVVAHEPEVHHRLEIALEDDGAAARHPLQLAQPGGAVGPVVVAEDRHRGVERAVGERQRLGGRLHGGRRADRALGEHHRRRLDGDDVAVARLIAAGARADVDDGASVAEGGMDRSRKSRVLPSDRGVSLPYAVVEMTQPAGVLPDPDTYPER